MIPYGRHQISEADIDAVVTVLHSDFLTQGPVVPAFEDALAQYCGAKHAVAVNSATAALHLACLALGVGRGDLVWTSSITFVASANCALYCGAQIDFIDIDPNTNNLSVEHLAEKLAHAKSEGSLPKVVIPVHLCGQSCNMAKIYELSKEYGFKIIEDASHAIGGKYLGEPIGGCQFSDIVVFSFHPVKIITTGEGGAAVTQNVELADRMKLLRSHGITRDRRHMTSAPDGPWYYQQIELGFNYRMTELQAALGLSQLGRLTEFADLRKVRFNRYHEGLKDLPLTVPWQHPDCDPSWHLYVIRLQLSRISRTHVQIFETLQAKGIGVNLHYIPVYLQPYYRKLGFKKGYCPEAERYYSEAISIPLFPGLLLAQQDEVIEAITSSLII